MAALDSITGMPNLPVTSAARASFKDAPKGYMGPKEIAPIEEEIGGEIVKAKEKVGQADIDIEKAKREEKVRELESKATGLEKFAQEIEQMPERMELKEIRKKEKGMEFIPTKDTAQDIAGLFSLISVVGMVLGKSNAQGAMQAMNGMLEGYQKGRQDLFKKEATEFDKNFKAMQTKFSSALSEYQEALKVRQTNKEAGELREQAALAKMESPLLNAIYQKQGSVAVLERLQEMKKSTTETMPNLINNLQNKADDRENAIREKALNRQNQFSLENLRAGLKNLKDALPMVQGVRGIEKLQKQLADPEVQNGLLSKTAPWIEKIKSIADSTGDFESAVNKELTGTDKTTLFLKDALLESYNIERAAKGGQRLTVQDMKMIGPVLDPTNYSPQTYNQLLEGRRKVLYSNLQDVGYTPAMIQAQTAEKAYTPFNAPPATAKYTIGQEITKGNKKYRVVDLSDPNDPDLEEVK